MRHTITVLTMAAAVGLTAGCAESPQRVNGAAGPMVGPSPITSASPSPSPTPVATSPSVSPPASPSTSRTSKTPPKAAATVFGPAGLGALKIGMTRKAAEATGLVSGFQGDRCGIWHLKDSAAGEADIVQWSTAKGVIAIPAYGRLATPEGIRVGSTLAQVKRAYSDFTVESVDLEEDGSFGGTGRAFAGGKDGYDKVHYRFDIDSTKVTRMWLEHDDQDCYE